MVAIKEILEEISLVSISSREAIQVIIKGMEEETGITILMETATSIATNHLEILNHNGMSLNLHVKFVSKQATLLMFAGSLRSLLLQVSIGHHQTEIQMLLT